MIIKHMELSWLDVEKRLLEHPDSMDVLRRMEESGGEPVMPRATKKAKS